MTVKLESNLYVGPVNIFLICDTERVYCGRRGAELTQRRITFCNGHESSLYRLGQSSGTFFFRRPKDCVIRFRNHNSFWYSTITLFLIFWTWLVSAVDLCIGALVGPFMTTRIHYCDVIMGSIASQITSLTIVYLSVYSGADQRKHKSSASLAFAQGIHRRPVNSPHKGPVTRQMFPFDGVIMYHVKNKFWSQRGWKFTGTNSK